MKITIRLVVSLVIAVTLVAVAFTAYQVRVERGRLLAEIERRANVLAESLQESVGPLVERRSLERLRLISEKFGNRERLKGVAIYDFNGMPLALTSGLEPKISGPPEQIVTAISENRAIGGFAQYGGERAYVYALPVVQGESVVGGLALLYDPSFIDLRLRDIWKYNFVRLLTMSLSIVVITVLVVRWSITGPIAQISGWARELRLGKEKGARPVDRPRGDVLAPLVKEVAEMARSLVVARERADEEAKLRVHAESLWTPNRLKEKMKVELGGKKLFLVSNREPYMHMKEGRDVKCIVPAGGLITALDPVMRVCDGVWVAHGSGDSDREATDDCGRLRVPPEEPSYTLRRVWLTKDEEAGYYYGFSNEGIWPLCHNTHTRPVFRLEDWVKYQEVNAKFAEALLEEIAGEESPLVIIQDYHLALVPLLIKEKRPDARVGIFWHIPWPNPEAYGICPWHQEILAGMLGADIIGFHIQYHCNNFLDTVESFLQAKVNWEMFSVNRGEGVTLVKPFPISVDFSGTSSKSAAAGEREALKENIFRETGIHAQYLGIGVDRIDYTKGIPERFKAVERFLEKYPEFIERFTFVELGAPSRTYIKRYHDLVAEVEETADRINWRFRTKGWKPVVLLKAHHSHQTIIPFYKAADVCMVTSLHDGMNLVAKEFVAARDDEDGALILSKFTGASRELTDSLIVNPYDIEEMADAIYLSLTMEDEKRMERMRRMRAVVRENNIYCWAGTLISELARLRAPEPVARNGE